MTFIYDVGTYTKEHMGYVNKEIPSLLNQKSETQRSRIHTSNLNRCTVSFKLFTGGLTSLLSEKLESFCNRVKRRSILLMT